MSGSLASVLISFVAVVPKNIPLAPRPGANGSSLPTRFGHFTGFNTSTLKDNLGGELGSAMPGSLNEGWAWVQPGPLESLQQNLEVLWEVGTTEQYRMQSVFGSVGRGHKAVEDLRSHRRNKACT